MKKFSNQNNFRLLMNERGGKYRYMGMKMKKSSNLSNYCVFTNEYEENEGNDLDTEN